MVDSFGPSEGRARRPTLITLIVPFKFISYLIATIRDGFVWGLGYNICSALWEKIISHFRK